VTPKPPVQLVSGLGKAFGTKSSVLIRSCNSVNIKILKISLTGGTCLDLVSGRYTIYAHFQG
jgi:hypothetical protein